MKPTIISEDQTEVHLNDAGAASALEAAEVRVHHVALQAAQVGVVEGVQHLRFNLTFDFLGDENPFCRSKIQIPPADVEKGIAPDVAGPDGHTARCPVWAPDGRSIAFLRRVSPNRTGVFLIRSDGSDERKLTEIISPKDFNDWHSRSLAWTLDLDLLVIRDSVSGGPFTLSLFSIRSGDRRVITAPPINSDGDDNPAISPDGRMLAFTRRTTGLRSELFIVGLSSSPDPSSAPHRLTTLDSHVERPAWRTDDREIVFATAPPTAWIPRLMVVPVSG